MSSKADQILDRIETRLNTIKISAGYSIDVKKVQQGIVVPEQMPVTSFPVLFITDGDKQKKFADVDEMEVEFDVIITGITNNAMNPETSRRKLEEAVEICLTNSGGGIDHFLKNGSGVNDLCIISVLPSTVRTDKGSMKPYAYFDSTFKIKYFQAYGTP